MNTKIKNIHNYIRDYTKISSEDKCLFIASILISLKNEKFVQILDENKNIQLADFIIEILQNYKIEVKSFEFLKISLNNTHLYNLSIKINEVFQKNIETDVVNIFYTEFVKYQNTDSKSLGIVLTPHHIVKLMCDLIELNKDDIILDLCSGTGSFLCEAVKFNVKKVIGCEYQTKLFSLLQVNMLIRNVKNYDIYNKNCFDIDFQATKSIINPPYGSKEKELTFILKQLESISENGYACSIIPIGCLNIGYNKLKKQIMEIGKIKTIIRIRKDLFKDTASVETCIILIQKNKEGHTNKDLVNKLDYRDDGMKIIMRNGFQKTNMFTEKYEKILKTQNLHTLKYDEDWTDYGYDIEKYLTKNELELVEFEKEYKEKKRLLLETPKQFIKYNKEKEFKIGELFKILKKPEIKYHEPSCKVPFICASKENNGIKYYESSNENTFTGNKIVLVTGGDGGAGMAHYHEHPFNIISSTVVLSPLYNFMNKDNGIFISLILSKYKNKYSHSKQWNSKRIYNDIIVLPVDESDNINLSYFKLK